MDVQNKPMRSDFEASRLRFLEAADRVYVQAGYDGSTIRAITAEAKTSLARLNRHWSGKKDLFRDVFARHFQPIHAQQHARLDALQAQGREKDIGGILEALLSPGLSGNRGAAGGRLSHLVYSRALVDPAPEAIELVMALTGEMQPRVIAMLRSALPDVPPDTFFLAMNMVMGAFIYPQVLGPRLAHRMDIDFACFDWSTAGSTIAGMLQAGLLKAKEDARP
jgi:AcrR family transcriptional regulator